MKPLKFIIYSAVLFKLSLKTMKIQSKLLILAILIQIVYSNNCILHYCECPPFLSNDPSLKKSLFFNKYPYAEHYAILGRAKELHCCFGGNFTR